MILYWMVLSLLAVQTTVAVFNDRRVATTLLLTDSSELCFSQDFTTSDLKTAEINYVVLTDMSSVNVRVRLDGGSDDVINEHQKTSSRKQIDFKTHPLGTYEFCFSRSNAYGHVKLSVYIFSQFENEERDFHAARRKDNYIPHASNFEKFTRRIRGQLKTFKEQLELRSASAKRDRSLAENTFELVNFWGSVATSLMVLTLGFQVFLIRSVLTESSKVGHILRTGKMKWS